MVAKLLAPSFPVADLCSGTGFASRIFIVSLPTIAVALQADIPGIS